MAERLFVSFFVPRFVVIGYVATNPNRMPLKVPRGENTKLFQFRFRHISVRLLGLPAHPCYPANRFPLSVSCPQPGVPSTVATEIVRPKGHDHRSTVVEGGQVAAGDSLTVTLVVPAHRQGVVTYAHVGPCWAEDTLRYLTNGGRRTRHFATSATVGHTLGIGDGLLSSFTTHLTQTCLRAGTSKRRVGIGEIEKEERE